MAEELSPREEQTGSYEKSSDEQAELMRRLQNPQQPAVESDRAPFDTETPGPGLLEYKKWREEHPARSRHDEALEERRAERERQANIDAAIRRMNEVYDRD